VHAFIILHIPVSCLEHLILTHLNIWHILVSTSNTRLKILSLLIWTSDPYSFDHLFPYSFDHLNPCSFEQVTLHISTSDFYSFEPLILTHLNIWSLLIWSPLWHLMHNMNNEPVHEAVVCSPLLIPLFWVFKSLTTPITSWNKLISETEFDFINIRRYKLKTQGILWVYQKQNKCYVLITYIEYVHEINLHLRW
jgi:hypothetical protein